MFEKEAEEYKLNLLSELIEKLRQGYNCKELLDIELAFQKGAGFGYNKANEWHDLRKHPNDLPKNQKEVLCLLWEDSYNIGYYYMNDKMWHFNEFSISENVTAWCELPKFEMEE